jgi:hypothetical protein
MGKHKQVIPNWPLTKLYRVQAVSFGTSLLFAVILAYQTPDTLPGPGFAVAVTAIVYGGFFWASWAFRNPFALFVTLAVGALLFVPNLINTLLHYKPPCDGIYNRIPCSSLNIPLMTLEAVATAAFAFIGFALLVPVVRQRISRKG